MLTRPVSRTCTLTTGRPSHTCRAAAETRRSSERQRLDRQQHDRRAGWSRAARRTRGRAGPRPARRPPARAPATTEAPARRRGRRRPPRPRRSPRSRARAPRSSRLELGSPGPGKAATSTAFGACEPPEKTEVASTAASATTLTLHTSGAAPSGPTRDHRADDRRSRGQAAARVGRAQVTANSGMATTRAAGRRAPPSPGRARTRGSRSWPRPLLALRPGRCPTRAWACCLIAGSRRLLLAGRAAVC